MAIREYIGARYVPKFMGTYDPTQQYEALDVVDNGHGTSYISKIPTPAGTPLTNTTYWAIYGASSGAIINLQNQIDSLRSEVKPLKTGYIYNQQRKVLFITDSYGTFLTPTSDNFPYQFLTMMGCHGDVVAEGGSGFIGNGVAHTFLELYEAQPIDPDYTDIIFAGGYNDKDTFYGTIRNDVRTVLQAVIQDYPTANIWVVCCAGCSDSDTNYKLLAPLKGYQQACNYPNAHFINLSSVLMKRELLAMDNVHPGTDGMFQLALALSQAIKNQYYGKNETATDQLFYDANGTQKSGMVRSAMNGGYATVKLKSIDCTLNTILSNVTCDGNSTITIGNIHDSLIQGGEFNIVHGILYVRGKEHSGGNTAFYNIDGYYYLHDQELRFVPMRLAEGFSGWFSMYEIDYIKTPPMVFSCVAYVQ